MASIGGVGARCSGVIRWACALVFGGVWWWAAMRLVAQPGRAGPVEGMVLAGGWGLSLLPVHCVPRSRVGGGGTRRTDDQWSLDLPMEWRDRLVRMVLDGLARSWRRYRYRQR